MEKPRVRIYTDYKSPYAFVANKRLFELEEKHGVELEWLPYTHLTPEMRRALLHRSHEFGDGERIGQPFEFDPVLFLEFEKPLVGDEGVGALVIGVDAYARLLHHGSLSGGQIVSRSMTIPARSRSHVSAVRPSARRMCFSTLAGGVFASSS